LFNGKVNLVSGYQIQREKQKKNKEKGEFYAKLVIEQIDFDFWCNSKINDR